MTGKPSTPDSTVDTIYQALLAEANKQQMNPHQFARRSGLPYASAHKILKGDARQPTLHSMMALADALGWSLQIRDRAGEIAFRT